MTFCKLMFICVTFTTLYVQVFMKEVGLTPVTNAVVLRAVRGRPARIPCGNGRVFLDGPQSYIIWLRADRDLLYRFPNDDNDRNVNDLPCDGISCDDHTSLLLKKVTDEDSGRYRCRVHYQASPSVDYVFELILVEPPGTPKIFDGNDVEIVKGFLDPISLGSDLHLICFADDNRSDTVVYWRRNNEILDRGQVSRPGVPRADMRITNVTRSENNAHYECLAQNSDVTEPLIASVVIKMYLAPLSVEIRLDNNFNFEAGEPRVVDCVVVGCSPPPIVTWYLGNTMLKPTVHKEFHEGNYTVSSLTLTPTLRNSHDELLCRVHNSKIPNAVFEDRITMFVGFRPKCVMVREDPIGVIVGEEEALTCVVESSPEPLQYSWHFGNAKTLYTGDNVKVTGHTNRHSSTLRWMPSESDIGQLVCSASNLYGNQTPPCIFNISLGGPPLPPNCDINRYNSNTWFIQCHKSWDGGRPQTVHLEVYDQDGVLVHNASDLAGNFHLPQLQDKNMTAVAYSSNIRGRSVTKVIYLQKLKPTTHTAVIDEHGRWTHWPMLTVMVAVVFLLVGLLAFCLKRTAASPRRHVQPPDPSPDVVLRPDGSFHREPDFTRDDRAVAVAGTTNITVNQLSSCQNWEIVEALLSIFSTRAAVAIALDAWFRVQYSPRRNQYRAETEGHPELFPPTPAPPSTPILDEQEQDILRQNEEHCRIVNVNRNTPFLDSHIDAICEALEVVSSETSSERVTPAVTPGPSDSRRRDHGYSVWYTRSAAGPSNVLMPD